jgi:ATP-dependent Lhr-like helicase
VAGDRERARHADRGADRVGQDARGVPRLHRPAAARGRARALPAGTDVVYVSPLKALATDVRENLLRRSPRSARSRARRGADAGDPRGGALGRHAGKQRASLIKRPPHILVTTPESLYLMLTPSAAARRCAARAP